ncbi:MAG TPA: MarR family transcriptional regulator [Anaerolineales bacterium]
MRIENQKLAAEFLEIFPLVMRLVAADFRQSRDAINPAYFRLLAILSMHPCTLGDLAEQQAVSKPTMSNTITTLEERGWVARKRESHDRRVVYAEITRQGQTVLNGVHRHMLERLAEILEPLSEEKREALLSGLKILREVFETADVSENRDQSK